MSFDINQITAMMRSADSGQISAGKGADARNMDAGRAMQLQAAFSSQMQMAQSLLGQGDTRPGVDGAAGSFDESIMNDALMFDALSSLASIMRGSFGAAKPMKPMQAVADYSTGRVPNEIRRAVTQAEPEIREALGSMSAMFESGSRGIAAIGYDRVGGTSYGKYQIASKVGTMDAFLSYLDKHQPEWADRLRVAGPANTGSKTGGMPEVWKRLAAESPEKFEAVQGDFIKQQSYEPARRMILTGTGVDMDNAPKAVQEVLWSTAVQHGPTGASRIFGKVIEAFRSVDTGGDFNRKLVEGVYDQRMTQFGASTERVRASVHSRLGREKQLAVNMLEGKSLNRTV